MYICWKKSIKSRRDLVCVEATWTSWSLQGPIRQTLPHCGGKGDALAGKVSPAVILTNVLWKAQEMKKIKAFGSERRRLKWTRDRHRAIKKKRQIKMLAKSNNLQTQWHHMSYACACVSIHTPEQKSKIQTPKLWKNLDPDPNFMDRPFVYNRSIWEGSDLKFLGQASPSVICTHVHIVHKYT